MQEQNSNQALPLKASLKIPQLPEQGLLIGPAREALWELSAQDRMGLQGPQGSRLNLSIRLKNWTAASAARLLIRRVSAPLEASAVSPLPVPVADLLEKLLTVTLQLEQSGRFLIQAQYTIDGQQWFWMRGEALSLHVYPRQIQGLRMYTWLPNTKGPLKNWHRELPSIAEQGFSMIHILPLTSQGHSQSPYASADLFSFDPSLAGPEGSDALSADWEYFLATLKDRKLGLCLDLVLNHVSVDSIIAQRCPHWIVADETEEDGFKRAGFQGPLGWQSWRDLALINYAHPDPVTRQEIWKYMRDYALFWAGYAADTKGMVRLDNLHSTHTLFASALTQSLRNLYPELAILGEYFADEASSVAIMRNCEIDLLLATPWEHHFTHELRTYLAYLQRTQGMLSWFCPINSHDSGPPAEEFASVSATLPRYLLCACLGTGASGMSQGIEFGLLKKISFIGRNPKQEFAAHCDYRPILRRINGLLAHNPAFQQGSALKFIDRNHSAVIAALRIHPLEPRIYILVANLDIYHSQDIDLSLAEPELCGRTLFELLSEQILSCREQSLRLHLEPCGIRIIEARP